ncbi:MAG TPA: arginine--tRNA ligase [Anaerolineae bacterium]|nr:arginine--tRNA ligase [Anaerolineae bacterium]
MIRDDVAQLVYDAVKKAQRKGSLPRTEIPEVALERPRQSERGDYATSLPLKMIADVNRALKEADREKISPIELGQRIVQRMAAAPFVGKVEVAPPGFINVALDGAWLAGQVEEILAAGQGFGSADLGEGRRVQVEFGSANPTGPMHVGFGRNLVLGDALANVLEAAGYDVQREYYVNDAGSQMANFGESLYVRYCELLGREGGQIPEGGYHGRYIADWARQILEAEGERFLDLPY